MSRKFETKEVTNVKYIHYGDIHKFGDGIITDSNDLPSIKIKDVSKYVHLNNGDLVLADASEDYSEIAKPFLLELKDINKVIVISGLHTIAVRLKKNDPLFIYYLFNTDIFKHFGYRHGTGLKVFGIIYNELAKFKFYAPENIDEQKKIGIFLKKMDCLIQLQQQKLDKLKQLKQGYLQKVFPVDNDLIPRLRFSGFSDFWKFNKLGNVAEINTGSRNHQDSVEDGKYPFYVRSAKIEHLNEYDFNENAILVPGDGKIGEIFHYVNGKFALHQRVYKIDNFNGIYPLFLIQLFKHSFKHHAMKENAQGTVPSLRKPIFTNWSILIPNIEEQKKIGNYLLGLDNLIDNQKEKIKYTKNLKQGYLQKMFC